MGVKGLWSLLNPVARPVQIESMEGKRLAIDSSIWLYQFQATMRDKDGRVLVNAHVLGFLRRINKLLFHGIKPVFVFDGGAPALKRNTIAERKRKKQGAAINHAKAAEKLFAAQMRREAVKAAQAQREQQAERDAASAAAAASRYDDEVGDTIDENAIYLEDLERGGGPPRPPPPPAAGPSTTSRPTPDTPPDPREERRKKFRKHDPYRLPETTMPTVSTEEKPDARLATEAELQHFIDEMRPSDIDVESAEFRALPTEVQYEIIGDLRIRSRQQSHKRLTDMLRRAPTSLDFSMAQIKGLAQRNALTQQLLTVTDMVGKAHLTIPVRIAAERNREYVLLKRGEDVGGGWALGIREGTKEKPIQLEEEVEESGSSSEGYSSDSDVEEIKPVKTDDNEVVERRRKLLEAITARYAPAKPARRELDAPVVPFGAAHAPSQPHLFASAEDDDEAVQEDVVPTANDEALALALQQEELGSDEDEADPELARALAMSRRENRQSASDQGGRSALGSVEDVDGEQAGSDDSFEEVSLVPSTRTTPALETPRESPREEVEEDEDDFEEVETPPIPAPTTQGGPAPSSSVVSQRSPTGTSASRTMPVSSVGIAGPSSSGTETQPPLLRPQRDELSRPPTTDDNAAGSPEVIEVLDDEDEDSIVPISTANMPNKGRDVGQDLSDRKGSDGRTADQAPRAASSTNAGPSNRPLPAVAPSRSSSLLNRPTIPSPLSRSPSFALGHRDKTVEADDALVPSRLPRRAPTPPSPVMPLGMVEHEPERMIDEALAGGRPSRTPSFSLPAPAGDDDDVDEDGHEEDDSRSIEWSRSPSPRARPANTQRPPLQPNESAQSIGTDGGEGEAEEDGEMNATDMADEQDDYARFLASIKNRDLNEVRTEIDDEIRVLNGQNKVAMRDSDEITLAMIAQIQTLLRHFGIPYITAPMEAEAQCAKLAELGLVDGIITDDSDVFLFGGVQCFKNIFNDAKYAECFLSSDVSRELSLSRDRLISLAFLLGSDYTIGLPGVGPVVALELLANFPGPRGIEDFKEWWGKVQTGRDGPETNTKWKQSFKKRYAQSIFLTADWPNPLVREAYLYPTVDASEEPFHWGFPKLSALRSYLHEELSWSISKVDDELVPIVQRIARRGKQGAMNKQSTLDPFFDLSAGALANYAPRRKTTANVSKRLLGIIKQFREAEARVAGESVEELGEMLAGVDERDPKGRGMKRGTSELVEVTDAAGAAAANADADAVGSGGQKNKRAVRRRKSSTADTMGSGVYGDEGDDEPAAGPSKPKRARKKAAAANEAGGAGDEETPAKRKRSAATSARDAIKRGSGVDGEMDDDEVPDYVADDITQVPPEERQKWRRAQQKKWRRAAVAGSVRPS